MCVYIHAHSDYALWEGVCSFEKCTVQSESSDVGHVSKTPMT